LNQFLSQLLVREEAETNPAYGSRPEERAIEDLLKTSIIVLDKPRGPSSHTVTKWIRSILGIKRVGHCGTLEGG